MKVVHLMAGGDAAGGIETLMADYAKASNNENIFIFAWGEGPSVKWIREAGCQVVVLDGKKTGNRKMIFECIRAVKRINPNYLIIQHATPELRFIGIILSRKYPTYVYHHSNAINEYSSKGIKKIVTHVIYMLSTRVAQKNIAISESVKKSVHECFKIPNEKIEVIYNGIDLGKFHPKDKKKKSDVSLIYVGRLVEGKGVQVILAAMAKLPRDLKFHLTIVGDGTYRKDLEQICTDNCLEDRVTFLGQRNDIPDLLREHDVFITVPTLEEGLGNSLIEAMACGDTCVCSESGGLSEIIENGKDGYTIGKNDVNGLYNLMKELIHTYPSEITDNIEKQAIEKAKKFDMSSFSNALDSCGGYN